MEGVEFAGGFVGKKLRRIVLGYMRISPIVHFELIIVFGKFHGRIWRSKLDNLIYPKQMYYMPALSICEQA